MDAVLTAVPIDLNGAVLIDAVRAGKHVMAEKPICATPREGRRVFERVRPRLSALWLSARTSAIAGTS